MIRKIMITAATGFESKPSCPSLTYLVEILAEISESHCRRELASFHRSHPPARAARLWRGLRHLAHRPRRLRGRDRKSTRLNSSHLVSSYAVFCSKKKKFRFACYRCRGGQFELLDMEFALGET